MVRYALDERVGCVAVIDTTVEAPSPGLHRTDRHVVAYWSGRWRAGAWQVRPKVRELAASRCREMNDSGFLRVGPAGFGRGLAGGPNARSRHRVPDLWPRPPARPGR
jgi:hypothetical protein